MSVSTRNGPWVQKFKLLVRWSCLVALESLDSLVSYQIMFELIHHHCKQEISKDWTTFFSFEKHEKWTFFKTLSEIAL